jgi:hypothetical protein
MSAQSIDLPGVADPSDAPVTIRVQQYAGDRWRLEIAGKPTDGLFGSLKKALIFAQLECCGAPAVIEIALKGMVRVVHQDEGWRYPVCAQAADRLPPELGVFRHHILDRLRTGWRKLLSAEPTGAD